MKKTLQYIPKLVINGTEVSQHAKQVTCNIKDTEVTLNCTYIHENELEQAYTSSFAVLANDKEIIVVYAKVSNRVSATIYINEVLAFSSLSMQAVFTVLSTAYGLSKSTLNGLYIRSNGTRKQSSSNTSKVTVSSSFEF